MPSAVISFWLLIGSASAAESGGTSRLIRVRDVAETSYRVGADGAIHRDNESFAEGSDDLSTGHALYRVDADGDADVAPVHNMTMGWEKKALYGAIKTNDGKCLKRPDEANKKPTFSSDCDRCSMKYKWTWDVSASGSTKAQIKSGTLCLKKKTDHKVVAAECTGCGSACIWAITGTSSDVKIKHGARCLKYADGELSTTETCSHSSHKWTFPHEGAKVSKGDCWTSHSMKGAIKNTGTSTCLKTGDDSSVAQSSDCKKSELTYEWHWSSSDGKIKSNKNKKCLKSHGVGKHVKTADCSSEKTTKWKLKGHGTAMKIQTDDTAGLCLQLASDSAKPKVYSCDSDSHCDGSKCKWKFPDEGK